MPLRQCQRGGEITIKLENAGEHQFINSLGDTIEGSFVCLSVKDKGFGMDQKTLERIFEPFFTTKNRGEQRGTGLGLAVVLGIVENHNGHLKVKSTVGQGTLFQVYLPVFQTKGMPAKEISQPVLYGEESILLVDDEQLNIDVVSALLEDLGYHVTSLTSSEEA